MVFYRHAEAYAQWLSTKHPSGAARPRRSPASWAGWIWSVRLGSPASIVPWWHGPAALRCTRGSRTPRSVGTTFPNTMMISCKRSRYSAPPSRSYRCYSMKRTRNFFSCRVIGNGLARTLRFAIADSELVENLVDKSRFYSLAERLHLPVPPTRKIDPAAAVPAHLDLRFPIVIEPLTRSPAWDVIADSHKALEVASPAALQALWPRLAGLGRDLLAQELVPGTEACI